MFSLFTPPRLLLIAFFACYPSRLAAGELRVSIFLILLMIHDIYAWPLFLLKKSSVDDNSMIGHPEEHGISWNAYFLIFATQNTDEMEKEPRNASRANGLEGIVVQKGHCGEKYVLGD